MRQVILIPQPGGGYRGLVPSFPDLEADGLTKEETLSNLQQEIAAYFHDFQYEGAPMPDDVPGPILVIDIDETVNWWEDAQIIDT